MVRPMVELAHRAGRAGGRNDPVTELYQRTRGLRTPRAYVCRKSSI